MNDKVSARAGSPVQRFAVVAVFVGAAYVTAVVGSTAFALFAGLAAVLSFLELRRLLAAPGSRVCLAFGVSAVIAMFWLSAVGRPSEVLWVLAGLVLALLGTRVIALEAGRQPVVGATTDIATTATAAAVLGLVGSHVVLLRATPDGALAIIGFGLILLIEVAFASVGTRWFGRHRLAGRVSEVRSWEGAVAGALASFGAGAAIGLREFGAWTLASGLTAAGIVAIAGPVSDLVLASLKRGAGVGESAGWLPGGEVLDLVDGAVLSAPLVYWVVRRLGS